jgi:elongation factor Ts
MEITMDQIKELRAKTGAGIADCKEALQEAEGDIEEAVNIIRKKGAMEAAEGGGSGEQGVIGVYKHGVDYSMAAMVELNSETDFVSKRDDFYDLAHNLAMHVAAVQPKYLSKDSIPEEDLKKEKELWKDKFLEEGKPEDIVDNIVEGKMNKYFEEVCLMEQPYFKDEDKKVKDLIHEAVAKFGEQINIKRFTLWQVGESQ